MNSILLIAFSVYKRQAVFDNLQMCTEFNVNYDSFGFLPCLQ